MTLFATSLYCLQDCLVHFDDVKQQNDLVLYFCGFDHNVLLSFFNNSFQSDRDE